MIARKVLFSAVILATFVYFASLAPAQTLTTLASFSGTNGAYPYLESLVQGGDGNFYGTTLYGGANNNSMCGGGGGCGTVFKITPSGTMTTLYSFCMQMHCTDGSLPVAGLVQATDGNFYGTTNAGGATACGCTSDGCGTVFKITPAGTLTTLYRFGTQGNCQADGQTPYAKLVQATDGNFYGATVYGGANNNSICRSVGCGTVFKITPTGGLTTLYSFCMQTNCSDGALPTGGLVQATDGNFYGTAQQGGASSDGGTVFKITAAGAFTLLYSFTGGTDGRLPYAGLVQATDGNFYGTTPEGGNDGYGTVFKITSTGILTTVYSFHGSDGDGPFAGLVQATDGNFYGTTLDGGTNESCNGGCGTLFKITPTGALTTLYNFCMQTNCTDGKLPYGGLVQASDGNFYGTTYEGGTSNVGTVFKLSPNTGGYILTVLHTFTGAGDGGNPLGGLNMDAAGNIYGTASTGGGGPCSYLGTTGCGTIFELRKHSSSWLFNPLYSFQGGTDGEFPVRPMTIGSNGTFYGTTVGGGEGTCSFDGASECGLVFNAGPSSTPPRTPFVKFIEHGILYRFTGGSDGANPFTTLIFDSSGNIYGTAYAGGAHGLGAAVELISSGGGNYTDTVLYSFAGGNDGASPLDGLVADSAGNFYGTTSAGGSTTACSGHGCGTVFKLTPVGGGNYMEAPIYSFQGGSDGENPNAGVAIDAAGNLYGNTSQGGSGGGGTVYELSPSGGGNYTFNLLYSVPVAGLAVDRVVVDSSGNLYEALQRGGAYGDGQVLKLTHSGSNWIYTNLYNFTGGTDGAYAAGGVVLDSTGNLYGTTEAGASTGCGGSGCGIVWKLSPQ